MSRNLLLILLLTLCGYKMQGQNAGNALHFDGVNDYVTFAVPPVFNSLQTNDITVETWIKPESFMFSRVFFAQTTSTNFISMSFSANKEVYVFVIANGITYSLSSMSDVLTANEWTHIAMTWEAATKKIRIYINGKPDNSTASGGSSSAGVNNRFSIGARNDGSQYFQGAIDEFRIWSEFKTACEIYNTMNRELQGNESNLVAYYKFNAGNAGGANPSVTTLPDELGSTNGTLTNFALSGSTSNWITSSVDISNRYNLLGTVSKTICPRDTFIFDGMRYFNEGRYERYFSSVNGCDSIVTLHLSVNNIDTGITKVGNVLIANQPGGAYQWVDCNNSNVPVTGATLQAFTPSVDGNYAVQISYQGCSALSGCIATGGLSVEDLLESEIIISPNPGEGIYTIRSANDLKSMDIELYDITGKMVWSHYQFSGNQLNIDITDRADGMYLLKLKSMKKVHSYKLIKH